MKYVCNDFNALCTELNVQCLIQMDTRSYQLDFYFENLGDRKVAIFTEAFFEVIPSKEKLLVKMAGEDSPWMAYWDE